MVHRLLNLGQKGFITVLDGEVVVLVSFDRSAQCFHNLVSSLQIPGCRRARLAELHMAAHVPVLVRHGLHRVMLGWMLVNLAALRVIHSRHGPPGAGLWPERRPAYCPAAAVGKAKSRLRR